MLSGKSAIAASGSRSGSDNRSIQMADRSSRPQHQSSKLRRSIEGLGAYQSLVLLAVPAIIVEPLKLAAVAIVGKGHWITGAIVIVFAYAASLLLVERLFKMVKPKLLTLPWFARLWNWFLAARGRALGSLTSFFGNQNCSLLELDRRRLPPLISSRKQPELAARRSDTPLPDFLS